MTVIDLERGRVAEIVSVGGSGEARRHLLDMGILPGARVKVLGRAPMGDPVEILVHGYSLTLRLSEAGTITVEPLPDSVTAVSGSPDDVDFGYNLTLHEHNSHPGFGEEGKYHSGNAEALPRGTVLTFALVGQQNSGKTSLFNVLTGSGRHVGNFPGVTVEGKTARVKGYRDAVVTDLPGAYSMFPYTSGERLTRDFILTHKDCTIINVVNAGNIERDLYLTVQLMELGRPMVVALNMMDEVRGGGGQIRINEMERILGLPVVAVSAKDNEGVDELVSHALHVARYCEAPLRRDFCDPLDHGGAVHRCLHGIMHLVEDHCESAGIPVRFAASKVIEGDPDITGMLKLDANEIDAIGHIIKEMEDDRGMDRCAAVAEMRYAFIDRLCRRTVAKPPEDKAALRSRRLDRVLTGKWTAIPIFIAVMISIIWVSISLIGAPLQNLLASAIGYLAASAETAMQSADVAPVVRSLVTDAIFGGVGYVISFIPIIIVLFFFISILEDSGYMARVAFVTDRILRRVGLSGRSIIPLLIGFGCSVPAVMSARTLPSARDRRVTILLTPFMSCSAKIPVYAFISEAFFPGRGALVLICLYLLSLSIGVLVALVSKYIGRRRNAAPFVMELPNYRVPGISNVWHLLWDRTKDFLRMAFTVLFVATLVVWFLRTFDWNLNPVSDDSRSILASIAGAVTPLFRPLGLGDWRIVTALISGFMAKESIVSTIQVLGATSALTAVTAVPLLVFVLLYTPCVAAIASIRRELGRMWAVYVVVFQCLVAWAAAFVAYHIAVLL